MPDDKWGERPCAFIELASGEQADADDLRQWCRDHLAAFKMPDKFVFAPIPRTATGKIQKVALREQSRDIARADNNRD
jgi:fatty-acyl-CoA synthase